jgi:RNA polymerase sigma-70 factor, ECF subfamily
VSQTAVVGDPDIVEHVRLAQEGSAHAFALLYDRYVDQIFGYVYHRVGHRQTAEDLVSDVFLRALRRIESFKWQGVDFGAWLMTIARNRVHDHFKSARFRLEATVEEVFDTPVESSPDDPERAVITGDIIRHVHAALRELKGEQAEVLYLRFIQHLSVAETAAVMGKKDGAIKALQYRALKSLAKHLPEGLVLA